MDTATNPIKIFANERLVYRLEAVSRAALESGGPSFRTVTGASIRQLRMLRIIDDFPGITFNDLVKATHLEKTLVSRLVRSLQKENLVLRKNNEEDARQYLLYTTECGRVLREHAKKFNDKADKILKSPLDKDEIANLNDYLQRLGRWIESDEFSAAMKSLVENESKLPE